LLNTTATLVGQLWREVGRTVVVVLNKGTLTSQRYIDEISDTQVRLYAGAVDNQWITADNKVCPHRARVVQDYRQW
jgi:hypothetical protein